MPPNSRGNTYSLLPLFSSYRTRSATAKPQWSRNKSIIFIFLLVCILFNLHTLNTIRRDLGYIFRPLWDRPDRPYTLIDHYPSPGNSSDQSIRDQWCKLHGWTARPVREKPTVVDAIMLFTETDMLELRIQEYLPLVDLFVIVEADRTHSGDPKKLSFPPLRQHFEKMVEDGGSKLVYHVIDNLEEGVSKGSFKNEVQQRVELGKVLTEQKIQGKIPAGSLLLSTDLDEIISRNTLELLTSCQGYPDYLQINVRNYRYGFNFPLPDQGYPNPNVHIVEGGNGFLAAYRRRMSDTLLMGGGWHCSWCFPTLDVMREKMKGYAHNDRLRTDKLLEERMLREKVCKGEDPFGMYAEAFTFRDIISQTGPIRETHDYTNLPVGLSRNPERFGYLLGDGCNRPDH